jgi:hypothetical protein
MMESLPPNLELIDLLTPTGSMDFRYALILSQNDPQPVSLEKFSDDMHREHESIEHGVLLGFDERLGLAKPQQLTWVRDGRNYYSYRMVGSSGVELVAGSQSTILLDGRVFLLAAYRPYHASSDLDTVTKLVNDWTDNVTRRSRPR